MAEGMAREMGYPSLDAAIEDFDSFMCTHKWIKKPIGGDPQDAASAESIVVCEACGCEKTE